MRVKIIGRENFTTFALRDRLQFEEDEVVEEREDTTLSSVMVEGCPLSTDISEEIFGEKLEVRHRDVYFLTKTYNRGSWSSQTAIGIPFVGSMGEGLGLPCFMGSAVLQSDNEMGSIFPDQIIQAGSKGIFTLEMHDGKPQRIWSGTPSFMFYAMMERWPGRLSNFAADPLSEQFRAGWSIASLVSCHPYPGVDEVQSSISVRGLSNQVRRHFWSFSQNPVLKEGFKTEMTIIGVATAWDYRIDVGSTRVVSNRVYTTCKNVVVPMKQYRTDLAWAIAQRYDQIQPFIANLQGT